MKCPRCKEDCHILHDSKWEKDFVACKNYPVCGYAITLEDLVIITDGLQAVLNKQQPLVETLLEYDKLQNEVIDWFNGTGDTPSPDPELQVAENKLFEEINKYLEKTV